jgi:hypothetical protein
MSSRSAAAEARIDLAQRASADSLDLSGLRLRRLPPFPAGLRSIRSLNLSGNHLQDLPPEIWKLEGLRHLDLGNSGLAGLPEEVGNLKQLRVLDLSENDLTGLPRALGGCVRLRELFLYHNQIAGLHGITLPDLRYLDLSTNQLVSVDELALSTRLTWLDLSNNKLNMLPPGFSSLQELEYANLSSNALASIDPLVGLSSLQELYVDGNALKSLPSALAQEESLRLISAENNPMGRMPPGFKNVSADSLAEEAGKIIRARTWGGYQPDKKYVVAPSFFFDFTLAITSAAAVFRFIDFFYKRRVYPSLTVKFPDGVSIDLQNVSRKTALAVLQQHQAILEKQSVSVSMAGFRDVEASSDYLLQAISRLPQVTIVPKAEGQAPIEIVNYNVINSFNRKEVLDMGDRVHIGSITNSNFNWKSKLNKVTQQVGASPSMDEGAKAELTKLLSELSEKLERAPKDQQDEAEAVGDAAEEYVKKANAVKPNKKSLEISGKGLLEAAKAIADVVPIATSIISTVTNFVNGLSN